MTSHNFCLNFFMEWLHRSSRPEVFLGKGVLKIGIKFTGEHPCRCAISIKLKNRILRFKMCCSVLMFVSTFTLTTKGIGKWHIRNIFLYDSWFYCSVFNRICKHVISCSRSVSRNTCWFVNCGNHSTVKHQIYKALKIFAFKI